MPYPCSKENSSHHSILLTLVQPSHEVSGLTAGSGSSYSRKHKVQAPTSCLAIGRCAIYIWQNFERQIERLYFKELRRSLTPDSLGLVQWWKKAKQASSWPCQQEMQSLCLPPQIDQPSSVNSFSKMFSFSTSHLKRFPGQERQLRSI